MSSSLPSRLARALLAAASLLLLAAPPALAAADKSAPADASAKKPDDKAAAKDKSAKKDVKSAKKDDAKGAKSAKKDDAKSAKKDEKAAKKDAKSAKKDDDSKPVKGPASIGAPNKGSLKGAVKLHSSRSLKIRQRAQAWGTPELVKLLQRAAGKVAKRHPRSVMLVGDLSQKSGGTMVGHNSHQSGRDADVGFYIANSKGQPAAMLRFVPFDGTGKSTQVTWAQFDDARNWTLIEALLTDSTTPVRYIFVSNPLRARMLAYALKKKVAKDVYTKAESVLLAPRDADVHDDHFHVRITCPESMKSVCIEESTGRSPAVAAKPAPAPKSDADSPKDTTADAKPTAAPDPKIAAAPDTKP